MREGVGRALLRQLDSELLGWSPLLGLGVCSQPPPSRGHFPSTLPPDHGRRTVQGSLGGWVAQSKQASTPPAALSRHNPSGRGGPSAVQPVCDPTSRSCLPHAR